LTLVLCVPVTGRTHQIRVHLKHLGHPIADDPLYEIGGAVRTTRPVLSDGRTAKRVLLIDDATTRTVAPFEPHAQQLAATQSTSADNNGAGVAAVFRATYVDYCGECANPFVEPLTSVSERCLSVFDRGRSHRSCRFTYTQ
jgi:hypothetical protein